MSEYNENRLCMVVYNAGPDEIRINTNYGDVSAADPLGILVTVDALREFSWQPHGEICWQIWYANCTRSTILYWEWIGMPVIEPCVLTPNRSKFDIVACPPTKIIEPIRPKRMLAPLDRRIFLEQLVKGKHCNAS